MRTSLGTVPIAKGQTKKTHNLGTLGKVLKKILTLPQKWRTINPRLSTSKNSPKNIIKSATPKDWVVSKYVKCIPEQSSRAFVGRQKCLLPVSSIQTEIIRYNPHKEELIIHN